MKVTTKILSDFLKKIQLFYRVQQNRISYQELIEFMYKETPSENYNFLIYNYTSYIEKVKKFGLYEKKPPLFSVIIATYNRCELLKKSLEAIVSQKEISAKDTEIIIADNGSTDKTESTIDDFPKNGLRVIYIKLKKNYGADLARNVAVLNSWGNFLAFTDDDCVVPNNWLIEFKKELEADPEIAAVGGFKEPWPIENHLDIYQRFLMWKLFYYPHVRTKEFNLSQNHCGLTANVCYRRDNFKKLGGFNLYFKHVGFREFKIRAHQSGLKLLYEPKMVKHFANHSLGEHVKKCLIQGIDLYFLYLLYPSIQKNPTFLFFLKRTISDIKLIFKRENQVRIGESRLPLFSKSISDIVRFSFLSIVTNFCRWFGRYWLVAFG